MLRCFNSIIVVPLLVASSSFLFFPFLRPPPPPFEPNPLKTLHMEVGCRTASDVFAAWPKTLQLAINTSIEMRKRRHTISNDAESVVCNQVGDAKSMQEWAELHPFVHHVFSTRAAAGACNNPAGASYGVERMAKTKCQFEVVAELLQLHIGDTVLDWGAGCGHQLDLIAERHGFLAVMIDAVPANVAWAQSNLKHLHAACVLANTAGNTMSFASNTFDAVLSSAAINFLRNNTERCTLFRDEILRVLRPGGCAWFGYNGEDIPIWSEQGYVWDSPPTYWTSDLGCFEGISDISVWTIGELETFGTTAIVEKWSDPHAIYSILMCKTSRL